jgi:glycosyltransferase involved in cell wall biosynthesis
MRVHVHLARGLSLDAWKEGFLAGKNPDASPYGYHHLSSSHGLSWSEDHPETAPARLCRLAIKRWLGFDLVHAWRNSSSWATADVVLTHTEYESLAVSALEWFRSMFRSAEYSPPALVAQSVWLIDRWDKYGPLRRMMYRALLRRAEHNITLSPVNARALSKVLGKRQARFVPFGISIDSFPFQRPRFAPGPVVRLLALGNDIHRDWHTLVKAFENNNRFHLKIVSKTIASSALRSASNIEVEEARSVKRIRDLYDEADIVVVPLSLNQHASGITVVLEAVARGKLVVCTKVGGIDEYFTADEIAFYECGNSRSLHAAVSELLSNLNAHERIEKAQKRFLEKDYSSAGYARRAMPCIHRPQCMDGSKIV